MPALAYFFLPPLACDRSDPATDFSDLLDDPLFSSFDAVEAAFFPVVMARSLELERVKNAWFMKRVPFVLLRKIQHFRDIAAPGFPSQSLHFGKAQSGQILGTAALEDASPCCWPVRPSGSLLREASGQ